MRLLLVRHGQTAWNKQSRYLGSTDIDLDRTGRTQAQMLSQRLRGETINAFYSSDLLRARHYAKVIAMGRPIIENPSFREMRFGSFEGLTHAEAMNRYPAIYQEWLANPLNSAPPKGEKLIEFSQRIRDALRQIISVNADATVCIVTHAGPIKVILCDCLGWELDKIWQVQASSASINMIEFDNETTKIISQNDTSYLTETIA